MGRLLSEQFQLGAKIGRPDCHSSDDPRGSKNIATEADDSRDDQSGACSTHAYHARNPPAKYRCGQHRTIEQSSMQTQHQHYRHYQKMKNVVMLPESTKHAGACANASSSNNKYLEISRTVSQDTAETACCSLSTACSTSASLAGRCVATHSLAEGSSLKSASSFERATDNANAMELSAIAEENYDFGTQSSPREESTSAAPELNLSAMETDGKLCKNLETGANISQESKIRESFPNFVSSMPRSWSGSSLSFIKFLLFVKESDESFIPEMDRMLADYDKLVNSLKAENFELKDRLKVEVRALKNRISNKKKFISKLTKRLTDCQNYITELTNELERIYKEGGAGTSGVSAAFGPRPDDMNATDNTVTSEITLEHSIYTNNVEATLSRMLTEERNKVDLLTDLNKSLTDDLAISRKEVDDLDRRAEKAESAQICMEKSVEGQWEKVKTLIEDNKTLQEDLAGVVIELSDTQEEFSEREAQLIAMIEEENQVREDQDSMELDVEGDTTRYDLEANIMLLQEELSVSRRLLDTAKVRENNATRRVGELFVQNETLLARNEMLEGSSNPGRLQIDAMRLENANLRQKMGDNTTMVAFAQQIIANPNVSDTGSFQKDQRIAQLEEQLASLGHDYNIKRDRAAKCLQEVLMFLHDIAASSTQQNPSALIKSVRETSQMYAP